MSWALKLLILWWGLGCTSYHFVNIPTGSHSQAISCVHVFCVTLNTVYALSQFTGKFPFTANFPVYSNGHQITDLLDLFPLLGHVWEPWQKHVIPELICLCPYKKVACAESWRNYCAEKASASGSPPLTPIISCNFHIPTPLMYAQNLCAILQLKDVKDPNSISSGQPWLKSVWGWFQKLHQTSASHRVVYWGS